MLAWKLLKGALPVGERLVERHVPIDPACKRCGEAESITYMFFQSDFARKVWLNAPFSTAPDFSGLLDLAWMWTDLCSITCLPLRESLLGHLLLGSYGVFGTSAISTFLKVPQPLQKIRYQKRLD